ncbi:hypothetical protein M2650_10020 [Luteimonas sp. SX5]|uniref:Lipoprotein n=1 Tax=Luteimonas galliterrae TaxID=2940486 RepID=A0ABT0MJB3_9GAMM|nr:hypothetical protein [Luteimonas galliterrae]MCL1634964.1 hypothetical protein [Luteimonas galliterrae]
MALPARVCLFAIVLAATAGCSRPKPPPTEQQPEPQAQHTELRDAVQEPIDKAKAVEDSVQKATDQQRAQIEAAGG